MPISRSITIIVWIYTAVVKSFQCGDYETSEGLNLHIEQFISKNNVTGQALFKISNQNYIARAYVTVGGELRSIDLDCNKPTQKIDIFTAYLASFGSRTFLAPSYSELVEMNQYGEIYHHVQNTISNLDGFGHHDCFLPDEKTTSFFWKDGEPYFYDIHFNECPLARLDVEVTIDNNILSSIKVLTFGDSFESNFCDHMTLTSNWMTTKRSYADSEDLIVFTNCSKMEENIQYTLRRTYGMHGSSYFNAGDWAYADSDINSIIKEVAKVMNEEDGSPPHAIIYGSTLWDIGFNHPEWCESNNTYDAEYFVRNDLCWWEKDKRQVDILEAIQMWNKFTPPWCNEWHFETWKREYLFSIDTLLKYFPTSKIYLRTQPVNAKVVHASPRCYAPMNEFIRSLAQVSRVSYERMRRQSSSSERDPLEFNNVDVSEHEIEGDRSGDSVGATAGKDIDSVEEHRALAMREKAALLNRPLFRLIDQYGLFISPNSQASHWNEDLTHLSHDSLKHYRAYYDRVFTQRIHQLVKSHGRRHDT